MEHHNDPYNLTRFVEAQDQGRTYDAAVAELLGGRKTSHWMWFVFPQVAGLGHSEMTRRYAISSLAEAQAYLRHVVLGPRLRHVAGVVAASAAVSAEQLFGPIDAQKLRSCMTLFMRADPSEQVFRAVLRKYFQDVPDTATDARL